MEKQKNIDFGKIILFILGGIFIGVANGLFGGGGGMLCVPLLLFAGLQNKKAQATAILIMTPISIASVAIYYSNGFIDWDIALYVMAGSILGGLLGALILKKFSNITLQYIFAILVLVAGIRMIF